MSKIIVRLEVDIEIDEADTGGGQPARVVQDTVIAYIKQLGWRAPSSMAGVTGRTEE